MRFDVLISELEEYARWQVGTMPSVAVLDVSWSDRIPAVLRWDGKVPYRMGPARVSRQLDVQHGKPADEGWFGDLELWPEDEGRVILRRVPLYEGRVDGVMLAAYRTSESIDRALT